MRLMSDDPLGGKSTSIFLLVNMPALGDGAGQIILVADTAYQ